MVCPAEPWPPLCLGRPCLEERHPEKDGLLVNLNAWEKKGGIASVWLLKTVALWKPSNSWKPSLSKGQDACDLTRCQAVPSSSVDTSRRPLQRDWGSAAHQKLCARPCVRMCVCTPTPTHKSCLRRSFSWILGSGCPGPQVVGMVRWSWWPVSKITLNASFALRLDC